MANLKQRLRRKNSSGSYDVIYLQSDMSNVTGTLKVANGGTGLTTLTSGSFLKGNGTGNVTLRTVSQMKTDLSLPSDTSTEINNLKTSVSEGKASIASAITDKGVSTSSTASFATMSSNIRAIATGLECYLIISTENGNGSSVTATLYDITLTGTVVNEQCILQVPSKGTWTVTVTSPTYGTSLSQSIYIGDGFGVPFLMCPQWVLNLKSAAVGSTTTVDGYEWIVVHKTSTAATLGLRYWYTNTKYANSGCAYAGSVLADQCNTFLNTNLSDSTKLFLNNVTVNEVTNKVFVPSHYQFDGGFSYYNSNARRVFTDINGTTKEYWTSMSSSYTILYYVKESGRLTYGDYTPGTYLGFRPHMEVRLP